MFEERLKEISKKLNPEKKEFFIITHKKYGREIYFQNNKKAIEFIKSRFSSVKKKIIYFFIKLGILQHFLKKIKLSSEFGDVIFVAGQIKSFKLNEKKVLSFIKNKKERKPFLKTKKIQKSMGKKGFSPKIIKINKKIPFSEEELLEEFKGKNYIAPFKKLLLFYKSEGIKKISSKKNADLLIKKAKKEKKKKIISLLESLSDKNIDLFITTAHGDFAKEQILFKKNSCVFTDWNPKKDLILRDFINFFNTSEKLGKPIEKNKEAMKLLEFYPEKIKKNFRIYIIFDSISSIIEKRSDSELAVKRLNRLLH